MDIYEEISKYEKTKMEAIRGSKNRERKQMNVNPDCYVAREIDYQTAILHEILEKLKFLGQKEEKCMDTKMRKREREILHNCLEDIANNPSQMDSEDRIHCICEVYSALNDASSYMKLFVMCMSANFVTYFFIQIIKLLWRHRR